MKYGLFGMGIFVVGVVLLAYFTHWLTPLGVWLMIWGNDIGDYK